MPSLIQFSWTSQHVEIVRLAAAFLLAGLVGEFVARLIRLPRITGYSLVGLALGPSLLGWFGPEDFSAYRLVVDLTLALLLFEPGVHVDVHWFRESDQPRHLDLRAWGWPNGRCLAHCCRSRQEPVGQFPT